MTDTTDSADTTDADTTDVGAAPGRLHGRRALVTGATSGIGTACAIRLARDGATVVVNYRGDRSRGEAVVQKITEAGGQAIALAADMTDEPAIVEMFAEAARRIGPIDLLVNNAGMEERVELIDMTLEQWNRVIETNLTGSFLCAREAARGMRDAGQPGTIVNLTSVHEKVPWPGFAHYCASKAGQLLMSQTLARELAPLDIRVVQVAPGAIDTPINQDVLDDAEQAAALRRQVPMDRIGTAEEIAAAVSWIASDEASYVTGATLFVDGGMTLYPGVT